MHSLETTEYNVKHCEHLSRAQWVSDTLKRQAKFYLQDFMETKESCKYDSIVQGIGDSYVAAFMKAYTKEFQILRRNNHE